MFLQLTPCGRVFLDKLTNPELVKKFPAFYRTGRFIATFTTARHLALSCVKPEAFLKDLKPAKIYEELSAPRPTHKLEDHILSAVRDSLPNTFIAVPHIGGRSSSLTLSTRHTLVTGAHLTGFTSRGCSYPASTADMFPSRRP